jgi:hypothetical protein
MKLVLELAAFLIAFVCLSNALRSFLKLRYHLNRSVSARESREVSVTPETRHAKRSA